MVGGFYRWTAMTKRWPLLIKCVLLLASIAAFVTGGHFAATALIGEQHARQLEELSKLALRRSESAVADGLSLLGDIARKGPLGCDPASLQGVRLSIYQRGSIKDVRAVDGHGTIICSAYSETLEFDQGWVERKDMLAGKKDSSLHFFRVDQFFGKALGLMKDIDPNHGVVAIIGIGNSLLDILPMELRGHGSVRVVLDNGQSLADGEDNFAAASNDASLVAQSSLYPIRVVIQVDKAALQNWDVQPYWPILILSLVLGAAFGLLLARVVLRPRDPVDELDRAIAAHEFQPYLQPVFDLETGAIIGAEILARQVRHDGTVIPPSHFIELAESSGRIAAITWQLLAWAFADMKEVMRRDPDFRLSINIAPRHFISAGFVEELCRKIAGANGRAGQVTLELTEREGFEDLEQAASLVAQVRSLGFRVALDDVGIGHSGLSQIQRLRADVLKIDKFFVDSINRDFSANVVVEMLVRLAAEMKMSIVAEGIERQEQADALRACGVGKGQGYLVAPPLAIPAFLDLVEERGPRRDASHRAAA
jgi:sensor c-di-GMP phosphodiesterase-like protein